MSYTGQGLNADSQLLTLHAQLITSKLLLSWLLCQGLCGVGFQVLQWGDVLKR